VPGGSSICHAIELAVEIGSKGPWRAAGMTGQVAYGCAHLKATSAGKSTLAVSGSYAAARHRSWLPKGCGRRLRFTFLEAKFSRVLTSRSANLCD
jgi:hypothetical protein